MENARSFAPKMEDSGPSKFARLKLIVRPAAPAGEEGHASSTAASPMDRVVKSPLLMPGRKVGVGVALIALVLIAVLYIRYGLASSLAIDAERLTLATASHATFREYIPITGNIVPARTVYLDAVEGGQVTQVLAEEGQVVAVGQPLLELKNTDLQLRLVEAEARLTDQVNNLNNRRLQVEQTHLQLQERLIGIDEQIVALERDVTRNERLAADGVVAVKVMEDMRGSLRALRGVRATVLEAQRVSRSLQTSQTAQMQSSVDAISANLGVARENLKNLLMRAPIAGRLTVFEAEVGEAKGRGQRIGQIDGTAAFKVSAMVDEFYLGRIAVGQVASVSIGNADHALEVTKIYPNVRERQFQIDLEFSAAQPADLRRGQTLRMNLEIGAQTQSLVVGNGPWVEDTGGVWAFVLTADGSEAHRRAVSIGRRNPDVVEITRGLAAGERLIVSSYAQLGAFDRIEIRGAGQP
jgi:HlyD family secretion protein